MVAVSLKKIFFKQKTAYEIAQCLVGSEMCIRDRLGRLYEALGQRDRAIAEYKEALAQQSDRDSARDRLRRLEQR